MEKHQIDATEAQKIIGWIRDRGGIAVWRSADLGSPLVRWTTPLNGPDGTPTGRPSWQAEKAPYRVITDAADVEVVTGKEAKRFRVSLARGDGLSVRLTDASSRKLRGAVEKAGSGAWYQFDYATQEAVVYVPGDVTPLQSIATTQAG